MLTNLSIKNYALIDYLSIPFAQGFTTITGETGAGKSILLGGLSLILGKRADLSSLRDKDSKCIVEAEFEIENYSLQPFFQENDLDYGKKTIIRREILPSGKSRAFINDSPVTLDILSQLGDKLIDIHSQHQTMQLTDNDFQMKVLDALANNRELLDKYFQQLWGYRKTSKELDELVDFQKNADKEYDYNSFLLKELEAAPLKEGILEELEGQYEQLNNVEVILEQLSKGHQLLNDEQVGLVNLITELKSISNKLSTFGSPFVGLNERIHSVFIEVDDIANELLSIRENTETDPELLEEVNGKLQLLHDLQKKHHADGIADLIAVKLDLNKKVSAVENIEIQINAKREDLTDREKQLLRSANDISKRRKTAIPILKKQLEDTLATLGMPNSTFKIEIGPSQGFKASGKDDLMFLFSANKGMDYGELKKVASGGELSRIMLTIKSILANYENLPTLMFDEIDSGVSGEISNKMGDIMKRMSQSMQVFSITHLPQVASRGDNHFKVFKEDDNRVTHTRIKKLDQEERVVELAEMLGGKALTDSAMAHARQLLN